MGDEIQLFSHGSAWARRRARTRRARENFATNIFVFLMGKFSFSYANVRDIVVLIVCRFGLMGSLHRKLMLLAKITLMLGNIQVIRL